MGKIYCKIFQACLKVGNYFLGYHTPEHLQGAGCVRKLPEVIRKQGCRKVLVVTDKNLIECGLLKGLLGAMEEEKVPYVVFSDLVPNPTDVNVEDGYRVYHLEGCDGIVAVGGGSPMDCAKGIAAKAVHPKKTVAQLQGILKVHHRTPPIFAVPTTAGTGSETTVAAVITIASTHHKASINDPVLTPAFAVLDPELTMGLPPKITSTTGMDALCHAVEAYTNATYNTKLENDLCEKAVRLIHDNILTAYENGSDLEARQNMQLAAFYAGRAFTRGCVGYVHAIGHTLGGLYGVPHGLAMSVLLPHVMRAYGPAAEGKLARLAEVCGMQGKDDHEKADCFLTWIEETNRKMAIPEKFDVIKEEDIPQIIRWADAEANPLYPTPAYWNAEQFHSFLSTVRS